jgi:Integrase core domain.
VFPDGTSRIYEFRTYEGWTRKYRRDGLDGLIPKKRNDKGQTRKLSDDAVSAIYALKERYPKINATIVYEKMIEDGVIGKSEVSLSCVQRFIKKSFGRKAANPGGKDRKSFEMERVNQCWQADTLHGPYIKNPNKRAYLQAIIDDKSRMIVAARFYLSDNAINFQATLKTAIESCGIPESAYFDNGGPYRNGQLSLICAQLGIVLMHTPVRDGAAKGKIERWNRHFRSRFVSLLEPKDLESLETLNDKLSLWVRTYNATCHSSTNKRPIDAFSKEAHLLKKPVSQEWLFECFLNRVTKKISRDAVVRIDGIDFDCPCAFIGLKAEFRFMPYDLSRIWLMHENERVECYPTDRVANSKTKRKKPAYDLDYTRKGN